MNPHNVKYLAKILCLKTEILRDPYAIISRDILSHYNTNIKYGDLISIVTVSHKIDSMITNYQIFNETAVTYTPIENDYGEPIIITTYLQSGHNKFPINFLYIDVVISDMFPKFVRLKPDEASAVSSMLQIGSSKESLKLPKMLETELVAKILYRPNMPLKIVRFYRNNMVTGIEIADRAIVAVYE
ncbi:RNA polymerase subunit (RPO22) [Eptesipox virus]|uniref:DNA-directed RNA polymerase subunit n=1 Tax=Eptesipox virus TaxID=1329402 RepID=A0A220T6D3_9POXV|nr:RNA polymerase subunit (RPO22) [Eptesipox virus]ASK51274.1 RNA polymerase subunit (RPO22) [Eptesipox virus]WAH71032.1 RNA polymerase subunit RPO22 [Eptesipox virus]